MPVPGRIEDVVVRYTRDAAAYLPWIGGALMALAGGFGLHSWRFALAQQRAEATVTENIATFGPKGGVRYAPRLRFRTPEGVYVQIQPPLLSEEPAFETGTTLPVLYPHGYPQAAAIATVWRVYTVAIVLAVSGIVLFDLGFLLRVVRSVGRRRAMDTQSLSEMRGR